MNKRKIIFCLLMALLCLNATALAKPVIKSDSNYFDFNTGRYILTGNVYVQTGSRVITADKAQVSMVSLEVWAQGNVNVTQDDILFTGQEVYVVGKQSTAYISGGVDLERNTLSIKANSVSYNWKTKIAEFIGSVSVIDNGNSYTADKVQYDMANDRIL